MKSPNVAPTKHSAKKSALPSHLQKGIFTPSATQRSEMKSHLRHVKSVGGTYYIDRIPTKNSTDLAIYHENQ